MSGFLRYGVDIQKVEIGPVRNDSSEVEDEIVVDKVFGVSSESLLLLKGSNSAASGYCLTEMRKNWRTSCRLNSLQLT